MSLEILIVTNLITTQYFRCNRTEKNTPNKVIGDAVILGGNMEITSKKSGSKSIPLGNVTLDGPSVVKLPFGPDLVKSLSRSGSDLVIIMNDGEQIVIQSYFTSSELDEDRSETVFVDEDGVS